MFIPYDGEFDKAKGPQLETAYNQVILSRTRTKGITTHQMIRRYEGTRLIGWDLVPFEENQPKLTSKPKRNWPGLTRA